MGWIAGTILSWAYFAPLLYGGDLVSLQDTLGHTDIRTTSRYAKAIIEGKRRLVDSFQIGEKYGEVLEMPQKQSKTGWLD